MKRKTTLFMDGIEPPHSGDLTTPIHKKNLRLSQLDDRGWTFRSNILLLMWLSRSINLMNLYYIKMRRAKIIYRVLTVFHVILATISSSVSFLNVGKSPKEDADGAVYFDASWNEWTSIFIGVATILAAIIASILAALKIEETISNQKYSIIKFSKLVRDIEIVLHAQIEDRPEAGEFLRSISDRYEKYHEKSDVLEERIEDAKKRISEAMRMNETEFPEQNNVSVNTRGEIFVNDKAVRAMKMERENRMKSIRNFELSPPILRKPNERNSYELDEIVTHFDE